MQQFSPNTIFSYKHLKNIRHLFYQQDNEASLLWEHWSSSGNHHDRRCKNVWCQNRRIQPQSNSNDIYIPGNLCRVQSTSATKKLSINENFVSKIIHYALCNHFIYLRLYIFTQYCTNNTNNTTVCPHYSSPQNKKIVTFSP